MWCATISCPECWRVKQFVWRGEKKPSEEDRFSYLCKNSNEKIVINGKYTRSFHMTVLIEWTKQDEVEGFYLELKQEKPNTREYTR